MSRRLRSRLHFFGISTEGVGFFSGVPRDTGAPYFWENWHLIRLFTVWLLIGSAALAPGPLPGKVPLDEFRARRAALRQSLGAEGASGVLLLRGRAEAYDQIFRFQQEPNFYYLTGRIEPDAALLLTSSDEILFLPSQNERGERYSGKRTSAEDADARAVTGFESVLPIEKLEAELDRALSSHTRIFAPWTEAYAGQLRSRYPLR